MVVMEMSILAMVSLVAEEVHQELVEMQAARLVGVLVGQELPLQFLVRLLPMRVAAEVAVIIALQAGLVVLAVQEAVAQEVLEVLA
jgi:predicted membrane-bound spermidine synthase